MIKKNIEDQDKIEKISSEESVISQELEETPQKTSVSLNVHRARWAVRRDGVMTCYTSNRRILGPALPLGHFFLRLPVIYRQLSRTSLGV